MQNGRYFVPSGEIRERAPETGWAHTTVKTLLSRLLAKGALNERRVEQASTRPSSRAPKRAGRPSKAS
ncbi:MAG: hypothetical protein ACI8QS_001682 [Planctomycetota bacterium]|jgi:hypothetical protein